MIILQSNGSSVRLTVIEVISGDFQQKKMSMEPSRKNVIESEETGYANDNFIDDLDDDFNVVDEELDDNVEYHDDDDDEDISFVREENICCLEVRRCKDRAKTQLRREWKDLKRNLDKLDWCKRCWEKLSMETLKRRLPILTWAPQYG